MPREKNARAGLAEVEWSVYPARSGVLTLEIGGQQIHSAYDPLREATSRARQIVEQVKAEGAQHLVLVGLGLGYLVDELQKKLEIEILVWDPFPDLTSDLTLGGLMLDWHPSPPSRHDALKMLGRHRPFMDVVVTSSHDAADALITQSDSDPRICVIAHPGYTELARFELRWIHGRLRSLDSSAHRPGPSNAIVSPRALDALTRLAELGNLIDLAGCLDRQTAVVVAPGPSLADSLDALAARPGGVLLAAVQAQRTLEESNVHVDFAVAPDPLHSLPFLTGFETTFGVLLAECSVEPELLDRWRDRTCIFPLRSDQLYDIVWRELGLAPFDEPFNTVSETMLVLAHHLGARRFVFVGVDLSGSEKGQFAARSAAGKRVLTNPAYFHAARFLSHRCAELVREGCEIWRVGDGLPIAGARTLTAAELPALLAETTPFTTPDFVTAMLEQREPRRAAVRSALQKAATAVVPGCSGGAVPALDPENRWSPYTPLHGSARTTAIAATLDALDASHRSGLPSSHAKVNSNTPSQRASQP